MTKQERIAQAQKDWNNGVFHLEYLAERENPTETVLTVDDFHGDTYDTAHAIIADAIEVELLDPDYNDRDPEYARVLGMYADEYDTEITMVDAIDTESDFDADEINNRYWVML
jgi:hypothetical protein